MPVKLKNKEWEFEKYCDTLKKEQLSAIQWMRKANICWNVNDELKIKINKDGTFKPYFGDTVVVPLKHKEITKITTLQKKLYAKLSDLLGEHLLPEFFHITIHDLNSATRKNIISKHIKKNKIKCEKTFKKLEEYFNKFSKQAKIKLNSTYIYPSCNISIVLGFIPDTKQDFQILMNTYDLLDEIYYLKDLPRFHLTLAYFKPFQFSIKQIQQLHDVLNECNNNLEVSVELDLRNLEYQIFKNMNCYSPIFSVQKS